MKAKARWRIERSTARQPENPLSALSSRFVLDHRAGRCYDSRLLEKESAGNSRAPACVDTLGT